MIDLKESRQITAVESSTPVRVLSTERGAAPTVSACSCYAARTDGLIRKTT
jgi:hypothetical protein